MDNNMSLKDLATGVAQTGNIPAMENHANTEIPTEQNGATMVGDTPVIIAPPKRPATPAPVDNNMGAANPLFNTPVPTAIGLDADTLNSVIPNITLGPMTAVGSPNAIPEGSLRPEQVQMLEELMPDMPEDERMRRGRPILESFEKIMKDLIVNIGLTPEEAKTAATNQIRRKLTADYEEYQKENPSTAVVTINKTDNINDLGLTTEEHQKLEKVKKVRLVVVEDMELANITIERPNEEHKADYVKSIEGSLSKYHVPLPMLGDFVGFKGAQIVQMINIINYEDSRIDETINTKASLIYEKLLNGTVLHKYNEEGKSVMSYTEFINKFPYQDIDMALYGILCASSMEESSTSLTCEGCAHTWDQKYNLKSLLKLDNVSDEFKQRIDDILKYKGNDIELSHLYMEMRKARRYKSPFSGNIYDLSYPSVARAINLLKRINQDDPVMTYVSAIALYFSRVLIYNEAKNSYVEVTAEETDLMLDTVQTLINEDMNMLANQIRTDFFYAPQFALEVECPSCHKKSALPLSIENLIFLKAQDSMVEIDS